MIKNAYPELPEMPYTKTSIDMDSVIAYIKDSPYIKEVKIATYIIFRNEGANGKSGICNNYIGLQTDGGRWDEHISPKIIGTTLKDENMTNKQRRFACFASFKDSLDILEYEILGRGLFVGGTAHPYHTGLVTSADNLAVAYYRNWVMGSNDALPDKIFINSFVSMYNQGATKF
jgi:hypothetical protein